MTNPLYARIAALEAENAALKADKARLENLCDNNKLLKFLKLIDINPDEYPQFHHIDLINIDAAKGDA